MSTSLTPSVFFTEGVRGCQFFSTSDTHIVEVSGSKTPTLLFTSEDV